MGGQVEGRGFKMKRPRWGKSANHLQLPKNKYKFVFKLYVYNYVKKDQNMWIVIDNCWSNIGPNITSIMFLNYTNQMTEMEDKIKIKQDGKKLLKLKHH